MSLTNDIKNEVSDGVQPAGHRKSIPVYSLNPFMVDVQTKTKRITNKRGDMALVSKSTGEMGNEIAGFWEAKEVDAAQFIKLFINGVKAFSGLTSAGAKVFEIMYREMISAVGKDQIYMSFGQIDQSITAISKATYNRGLKELIDLNFIAASTKLGLYWINPDYIFNGDRLAFVKEFRLKKSNQTLQEQLEARGQQRLFNEGN